MSWHWKTRRQVWYVTTLDICLTACNVAGTMQALSEVATFWPVAGLLPALLLCPACKACSGQHCLTCVCALPSRA